MRYYGRHTRSLPVWGWRISGALFALQMATFAVEITCDLLNYGFSGLAATKYAYLLLQLAAILGTVLVLVAGVTRGGPSMRPRYVILLVALTLLLAGDVSFLVESVLHFYRSQQVTSLLIAGYVGGIAGPILFVYAIFRHRIIDLGFVINRTLVYAVVSAILLIAFGLIEWAVDHFVTIEGREKNELVDAAIALGVFLTFHRVRDIVENVIEKLFFRAWHEKEAAFKRFIREAGFVTRRDALLNASVEAIERFAEGAQAAVYLRDGEGQYVRAAGLVSNMPAAIGADVPGAVRLRADARAVAGDVFGLPGGLALPMLSRKDVTGLIILGAKPRGAVYRPDEIEGLEQGVAQLALDLHALTIEALEAQSAAQMQRILLLNAELAGLKAATTAK